MVVKNIIKLIILAYYMFACCKCSLHSTFRYFERLKAKDFHVTRPKRSADIRQVRNTTLTFNAFQTQFKLELQPHSHVFHPELKITEIGGDGIETPVKIHKKFMYSGTATIVRGNSNRSIFEGQSVFDVDATRLGAAWMVHILTPADMFAVEPASWFESRAASGETIAYRGSDVRNDNKSVTLCSREQRPKSQGNFSSAHINGTPQATHRYETYHNSPASNKHRAESTVLSGLGINLHDSVNSLSEETKQREEGARKPTDQHVYARKQSRRRVARASKSDSMPYTRRPVKYDQPKVCDLFVIVDHSFFRGPGYLSPVYKSKIIASIIARVSKTFKESDFDGVGKGYYMVIKKIAMYTKPSPSGFNAAKRWTSKDLLESINKDVDVSEFCLAHLFTGHTFKYDVGLAYEANRFFKGGICAYNGWQSEGPSNVGLSTPSRDKRGRLTMALYSLVVTHEIGHNWGAQHDPQGTVCLPTDLNGGPYVMMTQLTFLGPNTFKFSPCSRRTVGGILKDRAYQCFHSKPSVYPQCGNGLREAGEQCDPGYDTMGDACCTSTCVLKTGAVCSPKSEICCSEICQAADPTTVCSVSSQSYECYLESRCTGNSTTRCPSPLPKPNGSPCRDEGVCSYGRCLSFCEVLASKRNADIRDCLCARKEDQCRTCCQVDGTCKTMNNHYKEDGSRCLVGMCKDRKCQKIYNNEIDRGVVHGALTFGSHADRKSTTVTMVAGVVALFCLL